MSKDEQDKIEKQRLRKARKLEKQARAWEAEKAEAQKNALILLRKKVKSIKDARKFLDVWLNMTDSTVSNQGFILDKDGDSLNAAISEIWLDYKEYVDDIRCEIYKFKHDYGEAPTGCRINQCTRQDLLDACESIITEQIRKNIERLRSQIVCETEDLTELKRFVTLLTGKDDPKVIALFAHWIWNIKRKVFNKSSTYHMLPVIYGKQGVGKTVLLEKLIKPFKDYTLQLGVDDAIDKKQFFAYSANFIAIFDELKGASRADVSKLKSLITADTVSARKYFTQRVCNIKQNCSFIATSNFPIREQILDNTGMRRFYQVNARDDLSNYWSNMDDIDFTKLIVGIDENKDEGYIIPHWSDINKEQAEMVTLDPLSLFAKEYNLHGPVVSKVSQAQLYLAYQTWCYSNGHKASSSQWFTTKLTTAGIISEQEFSNGKLVRFFLINENSAIFHETPSSNLRRL